MKQTVKCLCAALCIAGSFSFSSSWAADGDYKFEVINKTSQAITAVRASEDKKSWGEFSLGSPIKPGGSATLEWADHTNNSGCDWWVQADYKDGSSSTPAKFDFCQNPSLEFTE